MTRLVRLSRPVVLFAALALGGAVACAPTHPGVGPQTGGSILGTNGGGFSDMGQRETLGALIGGVAGAVAGAQYGRHGSNERYAMMAVGGLVGALLGQQIGQGLDRASQANQAMAFHRMMATGMPQQWHGQTTQGAPVQGGFHPLHQQMNGCRSYTQTIVISGRPQQAVGTACPNPDGTWRIVQ
jgi:surface antigen